jgi:hypothetical protein
MEVEKPFGIVTACHKSDYFMVKATCASIRHFCGEVPICVVVDGNFDVSELRRIYNARILRTTELRNRRMRELCSGSRRSKLAAMWCGPFERFIYLDADAMFWGDVLSALKWHDEDFIVFWEKTREPVHRSWLSHFYFDVDILLTYDPQFQWQLNAYFSSGAFASRRDAVSFDDWMRVESWRQQHPNLFSFTRDQGILNYLVFSLSQRGQLNVGRQDLQWIPVHRGISETVNRFPANFLKLPVQVEEAWVIHFCGRKPLLSNPRTYSRPFTVARLDHHRETKNELHAWANVISEEWPIIRTALSRRFGRFQKEYR